MRETWTIREVARVAGRAPDVASRMARAGMLPGYSTTRTRRADIPRELAEPFAMVLRTGAYSRELATAMRENPDAAVAAVEALATLVRAAVAEQQRSTRKVAA